MKNNKKLLIIGAGGHGKVCAEIAKVMNKWVEIVFADNKNLKQVNGIKVIKTNTYLEFVPKEYDVFIAIGDNKSRLKIYEKLKPSKYKFPILIHPSANISQHTTIKDGAVIMANSVINSNAEIGNFTIINTSSIVEHDVAIGSFSHLSPNATITGNCKIGDNVWIGASSTIINAVKVSDNIVVGAASLVNKNLVKKGTYIGVPAIYYSNNQNK